MSNDLSVEAEILRCGYNVGFFSKADIEKWADRQIEAIEEPPTALLDLSMIRDTHPVDVMRLLDSFQSVDQAASIGTQIGFIGLLVQKNRLTTSQAIRGLFALVHDPGITEVERGQIYYLDDGYDLAVAGTYGKQEDVDRELREFVTPYAERLAARYPNLIPLAA